MQIGIIGGTGPAGSALGARLASVGYEVTLGSREAERAGAVADAIRDQWPALSLALNGDSNEVAARADVVVVATPWDSAPPTVAALERHLDGKIVVSMANALARVGADFYPLLPPRGSIAVQVQGAVPRSRVVAAFHHLPAKEVGVLDHPVECDVLVCGDDRSAVDVVGTIAGKIPGCRALEAGSLSSAAAIEAFTATLLQLNIRYKSRVAPKFAGIPLG
ncbi:MAG: NADPH-dependent F420 reductase [Acidimicrobiia bacterium]